MTEEHQFDEDLLERLLSGELDPNGSEGRRVLQNDGELRARFERVRSLQRQLEEFGSAEREDLARGSGPPEPALEKRADDLIRERLKARATTDPSRRSPRRTGWLLAAAAALVGALALVIALRVPPVADDTDRLGGVGETQIELRGRTDPFEEIGWTADLPFGAWFRVVVYDDEPARGGSVLATSVDLEQATWHPETDREAGEVAHTEWPETVWIVVVRSRMTGREEELVAGSLSRSH